MSNSGDRLRQARITAGFRSAAEAAEALNVPYPTYAGHENGNRGFGGNIDKYARRFGVRGEWLRTGLGPMGPGKKPLVQEIFDELKPDQQNEAIKFMKYLKTG